MMKPNRYLSFDLSTQQLKSIVIDDELTICHQVAVDFDNDLPEYGTEGGVLEGAKPDEIFAPVPMWLNAIEMCLYKLIKDGLKCENVVCISGAAQRHGSVWWRNRASIKLERLDAAKTLEQNLNDAFSIDLSPTWMDSSTTKYCRRFEERLGGPEKVSMITGSRAIERFTGSQIAKIYHEKPEVFESTERITLISNFLATIFAGSYMPFDVSDAAGMNLMNIRTRRWSIDCLKAFIESDKSFLAKLCNLLGCKNSTNLEPIDNQQDALIDNEEFIVDSGKIIGKVNKYFQITYGFSTNCLIASFLGDTPSSVAGLCLGKNELVISLGTSDTSCFWLNEPRFMKNGHMSRCPIEPEAYIGLVSFKNGSRTRERILAKCCASSASLSNNWNEFEKSMAKTLPGNDGNIGFYFDMREIYPALIGDYRFDVDDQLVDCFAPEVELRACIEGQLMRLYNNLEFATMMDADIERILVTGGASSNRVILQHLANIFNKPVYAFDMPNSACLGAAYLAKCAYARHHSDETPEKQTASSSSTFQQLIVSKVGQREGGDQQINGPVQHLILPEKHLTDVYKRLLVRHKNLEQYLNLNITFDHE